jgi:hypothetical protein
MVIAQGAHATTLEVDNAGLRPELEQAHQVLSASRAEEERECAKLCIDIDALKQEKMKVVTAHETDLVAEQIFFGDYRVSHRRKLHDLRVELEGPVNKIGARCLPYPKKGTTIGVITAWFTKEI